MRSIPLVLSSLSLAIALTGCGGSAAPAATEAPAPVATAAEPAAAPLTTEVFNPGEAAIFAVSSVVVLGQHEAILIDAQFSMEQARKLVAQIKASGRTLTTIYVSHGDPDYYFGLQALQAAFPDAKILATAQTVAHIEATKDAKLAFWGPQLGANAPTKLIVPERLQGDTLALEGQTLKVIGLDGPAPDRSVVWIPSIKTIAGGVPVMSGEHVWMADTASSESRQHWLGTLASIKALQPQTVIPGHYVGAMPPGLAAVEFTEQYLLAFNEEAAKAKDAKALVTAMQSRYPDLGGIESLEISAKVVKGEMEWN